MKVEPVEKMEQVELILVEEDDYGDEVETATLTIENDMEVVVEPKTDPLTSIFVHTHSEMDDCEDCKPKMPVADHSPVKMNFTHKPLTKSFLCHDCGKMFANKRALTRHTLTHVGDDEDGVSPNFPTDNFLEARTVGITQIRNDCPHCEKTFARRSEYNAHILLHADRKYQCGECGKSFERKGHLAMHAVAHSDVKEFQCPTCGKLFARNHDLTKHVQIHSERKCFICMECGKSFARKGYLQIHKLVHSGVKRYECVHCGKFFARSSDLNKHLLIHTGERRFECAVCGKTFTQNSHLKSHSIIHEQIKSLECVVCGNLFARKGDLKKHMNIHAVKNQF